MSCCSAPALIPYLSNSGRFPASKQPSQLKGTKLGVSRIGATTDFVARYLLKKWNLQAR